MLLLKCIFIVGFCTVHSFPQNEIITPTIPPTTTRDGILTETESPAIVVVSIPNATSIETSIQIPIPPTAVQEALPAASIQNALPDAIQTVVPPADKQGSIPPPASIQEILQLPATQEAEPVPISIVQVAVPASRDPTEEATPPTSEPFKEASPTNMVEKVAPALVIEKEIPDPSTISNETLDLSIQREDPALEIQKLMPANNTQNDMLPPAIQKEISDIIVQTELPAHLIQKKLSEPSIQKEILDLAVQKELPPALVIQNETPTPVIQNPTPAPAIQKDTPDLKEIPANPSQLNLIMTHKVPKPSTSVDVARSFSKHKGRSAGGDDETAVEGAPPPDDEKKKEPAKKKGAVASKKSNGRAAKKGGGAVAAKKGGGGGAKKVPPSKKTGEKKPDKPKEEDVKSDNYETTVAPPSGDEPEGRGAVAAPHMGRAVPEEGTTKAPAKKKPVPSSKKAEPSSKKAVASKKPATKKPAKKGGSDAAKKGGAKPPAKKEAAKKKKEDKPPPKKEGTKKKKDMNIKPKIVGGKVTKPNEYPYQVAILFDGKIGCGGSILNKDWILTASHCFEGVEASSVTIIAGEHNLKKQEGKEQTIQVEKIFDHEEYDPDLIKNDITVLKLSKSLKMNKQVQPIKLAEKDYKVEAGTDVTVTGWGHTKEDGKFSDLLRMVTIPAVDHEKCKEIYTANSFHDGQLCAGRFGKGGKDACQGDSGGPLVVPNKAKKGTMLQVGVVSYGMGCAAADFPGAYTEVSFFRDWIDTTISS